MHSGSDMPRTFLIALTLAVGVLSLANQVQAQAPRTVQATQKEKDAAAHLVFLGHEKRKEGDHLAALKAYRGADAIMRVPTTGIEVGRTLIALGRLTEAHRKLTRVAVSPAQTNEPVVFEKARAESRQLARAIDARVARLQLVFSAEPALNMATVLVDGKETRLDAKAKPLRLDPGSHVLKVSAPSFVTKRYNLKLAEGEKRALRIQLAPSQTEAPKVQATPPAPSAKASPTPAATQTRTGQKAKKTTTNNAFSHAEAAAQWSLPTGAWLSFALAGAGAVTGAVAGGLALHSAAKVKAECDGSVCPTSVQSEADKSNLFANIANAGFAVGLVGATVGTIVLVRSRSKSTPADSQKGTTLRGAISLTASPTGLWLQGQFQ